MYQAPLELGPATALMSLVLAELSPLKFRLAMELTLASQREIVRLW